MLYPKNQWQQTKLFFHCSAEWDEEIQASFQNDKKRRPMHIGHERGQLFIFLSSKENKIHKTISIHR